MLARLIFLASLEASRHSRPECDTKEGQILIEQLRQARRSAGWSQKTLAERISGDAQTIKRLERGIGSVSTLIAAMAALDFRLTGLGAGKSLSEQLRNRRRERSLSLDQMALRTGLSRTTIASLERGGGSVASLLRLLAVLAPKARQRSPERSYWGQGDKEDRDSRFTPPDFMTSIYAAFGEVDLDPCAHPPFGMVAALIFARADDAAARLDYEIRARQLAIDFQLQQRSVTLQFGRLLRTPNRRFGLVDILATKAQQRSLCRLYGKVHVNTHQLISALAILPLDFTAPGIGVLLLVARSSFARAAFTFHGMVVRAERLVRRLVDLHLEVGAMIVKFASQVAHSDTVHDIRYILAALLGKRAFPHGKRLIGTEDFMGEFVSRGRPVRSRYLEIPPPDVASELS